MSLILGTLSVAVELEGDLPPKEFRIFKTGINDAVGGDYLFDEQAANDVMAAFQTHGVDGMVDLEHLSLDDKSPNYDPDARGWFRLELRDGELWGVCATWTQDGERRLKEKTQRYLSPTFPYDKTTRRVKWLHNIALTATPALNGIPALVAARIDLHAASVAKGDATMAEDNSKAIADILKAVGMDPKMPGKVASALGLDPTATLDDISGAIAKFADMVKKAEELLKGETPSQADQAPPPAAQPDAAVAAASTNTSGSNAKLLSAVESLTERLAKQEKEAADKAEVEERAALVASRKWPSELLDWAGDKSTPIAEVKRLAAKFPLSKPLHTAADADVHGTQGAGNGVLSERELKICKDTGCAPETFAALKAQREAQRASRS